MQIYRMEIGFWFFEFVFCSKTHQTGNTLFQMYEQHLGHLTFHFHVLGSPGRWVVSLVIPGA